MGPPPSDAAHASSDTFALSKGIVEPPSDSTPRLVISAQPQKPANDGAPANIGIQRFDTAPEMLDGDGAEQETEAVTAQSQQHQRSSSKQSLGRVESHQRIKVDRSSMSTYSTTSKLSLPPPGSVLTGKQEHYLKRELLSEQAEWEISELSHRTALQRFGAPFRSDAGEVSPEDSELPILRYIFVHHVRNFPFLDQAREKEFWQDKLQVVSKPWTSAVFAMDRY